MAGRHGANTALMGLPADMSNTFPVERVNRTPPRGPSTSAPSASISCVGSRSSSSDIERLGLAQHLVPNEWMQGLRHVEIHLAPQEAGELLLDLRQGEVRISVLGLELDEHVDVAVGSEVVAEDRAEQGQPADVVPPAKLGDALLRYLDARAAHATGMILRLSIPRSSTIFTATRLWAPGSKGRETVPRYASMRSVSISALRFFARRAQPPLSSAMGKN